MSFEKKTKHTYEYKIRFEKKKRLDPGFFVSLVIYVNIVYIMKDAHALSYYKFDQTYFTYYLKQMYS